MKRRQFLVQSGVGCAALSSQLAHRLIAAESSTWNGWRGSLRNAMVDGDWPLALDEQHLVVAWTQELGDSYSGPIVSGQTLITTESTGGDESTIAFDVSTGQQIWKQTWQGKITVPFFAARNGNWIRSTPAADETQVYVGGIRDVLIAFDLKTGGENWRVDFGKQADKVPDFGMVCSPMIDGDHLYIQAGKGLQKINRADGSIVWSSLGDSGDIMSSGAFSSPIIAELNGIRQLVVQTRTYLAGVSLDSGEVYWKIDIATFRGMNILTPTIWNNKVFTSCYGGQSLLIEVKDNKEPTVLWENKLEGYMSSPILIGDNLYIHLRNRRFACLDMTTGEENWITTPFGEYWSMISNGKAFCD
jgi:outer membrane protein assembly factor BamB